MTRCTICGKSTTSPTEIFDKKWEIKKDTSVSVCPTCFAFWSSENELELEKRMGEKLR